VHTRIERVGSRTWLIVVLAILALGGGAVAVVLGMQSRSAANPTTGSGATVALAQPDASSSLPADAAIVVATVHVDAGDAWAIPDAGLADAGPPPDAREHRHQSTHFPTADEMVKLQQQAMSSMAAACQEAVSPKKIDTMTPINVAMCRCMLKQPAEAAAAVAKLSDERVKKQVRVLCAQNGIKL
jgi:hypothetical protein